jgi:hypothetical protein
MRMFREEILLRRWSGEEELLLREDELQLR